MNKKKFLRSETLITFLRPFKNVVDEIEVKFDIVNIKMRKRSSE